MVFVSTCLVTLIGIHRDKRWFPKVDHIDGHDTQEQRLDHESTDSGRARLIECYDSDQLQQGDMSRYLSQSN